MRFKCGDIVSHKGFIGSIVSMSYYLGWYEVLFEGANMLKLDERAVEIVDLSSIRESLRGNKDE